MHLTTELCFIRGIHHEEGFPVYSGPMLYGRLNNIDGAKRKEVIATHHAMDHSRHPYYAFLIVIIPGSKREWMKQRFPFFFFSKKRVILIWTSLMGCQYTFRRNGTGFYRPRVERGLYER